MIIGTKACAYSVGAIAAVYSPTGIDNVPFVSAAIGNCSATEGDKAAICSATPDCISASASIKTCVKLPFSPACCANSSKVVYSLCMTLLAFANPLSAVTSSANLTAPWTFSSSRCARPAMPEKVPPVKPPTAKPCNILSTTPLLKSCSGLMLFFSARFSDNCSPPLCPNSWVPSVSKPLPIRGKSLPPPPMILPRKCPPTTLVMASVNPAPTPACSPVLADKKIRAALGSNPSPTIF